MYIVCLFFCLFFFAAHLYCLYLCTSIYLCDIWAIKISYSYSYLCYEWMFSYRKHPLLHLPLPICLFTSISLYMDISPYTRQVAYRMYLLAFSGEIQQQIGMSSKIHSRHRNKDFTSKLTKGSSWNSRRNTSYSFNTALSTTYQCGHIVVHMVPVLSLLYEI